MLLSFTFVVAQKVPVDLQARSVIQDRLHRYKGNDRQREATLRQMFTDAECPDVSEQAVKGLKETNLICTVRGASDDVIMVGAHFDHVDRGNGVVDNWSGASLLPSLLQTVMKSPRRHTFIFMGFAGEEQEMVGSRFYVRHLTRDQLSKIQAMVNLDTLGLGPTEVWASHADKRLLNALAVVAREVNSPISAMNVDAVGSTDSEEFREKKVPAITLHTLTSNTLRILHSPRDQESEISWKDYYENYRLTAAYLVFLDSVLNADPQKEATAGAGVTQ